MAKKTILVAGYGPGISHAVAERFGREGFSVALVARNAERLEKGAKTLRDAKVDAAAFPADLGDPAAVRAVVAKVRKEVGPITVLHWNAYSAGAGDLLTAKDEELRAVNDVSFVGLVAGVQAALPDLKNDGSSAVLVTNGGLGFADPKVDAIGVQWNAMGLAVANAAKHKAVGLLSAKLAGDGVYVGEVLVMSAVKGTAFDPGDSTLEPSAIADKFFGLYRDRGPLFVQIG